MAKSVILDVLNSTIGRYVRNLDADSLNVAVWSGKIELHSLVLDLRAVNKELDRQATEAPNLALPFRVIGGGFDSLEVDVPWARLSSRPVVFRAKGLRITVEPCDRLSLLDPLIRSDENTQKRSQKIKEERSNSINIYNEYRLQANALRKLAAIDEEEESESNSKDKEEQQSSFASRLMRRVIENLQVEIEDVHVAFKNRDCSAGILLKSLSLVTTTKDGERTFVDRTVSRKNQDEESFLYKVLSINGFGIYLDDVASDLPFAISEDDMAVTQKKDHSYILEPLSFEAKLRQSDAAKCIDFPKYLLSSELPNLSLELTRAQLENIAKVGEVISPSSSGTAVLFPEYRPLSKVSRATAKEWWKYSFRCVRRLTGKRMWVEFALAFKKRKKYIQLYKRNMHHEKCSWMTPLSEEDEKELSNIEEDRSVSVHGIMAWRNIADAQAELETKKHTIAKQKSEKKGYLSFFGSADKKNEDDADDPPITLTVEEMKELEAISIEQAADIELSDDSQLCDIKFVLSAFKASLVNRGRPIVNVEMGTVSTSFKANADGSLQFNFEQESMEVWDACTPKTFFPTVLRNLAPESTEGQPSQTTNNAFEMRFEKSRSGDQELFMKVAAFELVASPLLTIEVKRFFDVSNIRAKGGGQDDALLLQQSLTGSVDLFFDAQSIEESRVMGGGFDAKGLVDTEKAAQAVSDFSNAMVEAWKNKTKEKSVWKVHCDVHAPVYIVPKDCAKLDSPALVFDLGYVKFGYGKTDFVTDQVQEWCNEQAKLRRGVAQLDTGVLELSNLTFSCARVKEVAAMSGGGKNLRNSDAVIEPVSAKLDLGVLSFSEEEAPGVCVLGVFPSLCLRMSPSQALVALRVLSKWQKVGVELGVVSEEEEGGITIVENAPKISSPRINRKSSELSSKSAPGTEEEDSIIPEEAKQKKSQQVTFHMRLSLQRLSSYFYREGGDGIECHLVSVSLSSSQMADGSLSSRLCMGWFWVLDMLETQSPRKQRLLAHSTLPRSAEKMASDQNFQILDELTSMGVFKDQFPVASDLADISYTSPPPSPDNEDQDIFLVKDIDAETPTCPVLEAKFTSLFIHWNPSAVKMIFNALDKTMSSLDIKPKGSSDQNRKVETETEKDRPNTSTGAGILIKAKMERLQLCLNSARDDLPLYFITVSDAKVFMISKSDEEGGSMLLSLDLGDVSLATPPTSANPSYQTLLGLAPGRSESLLTVKYFSGSKALSVREPKEDLTCEALADIKLSPMRFVHVHAQIMTLVDYATEGILGAIFQKAATSAASAAIEIASSAESANKIFNLAAEGFDVVLPQSAVSNNYFLLHAGDLLVKYLAFPDPGGGVAQISLGELSLHDHASSALVKTPIHMDIEVRLKPYGIGSLDDQAMLVNMSISKASFVVLKNQYAQIMNMLSENIGETNTFLRSDDNCLLLEENEEEGRPAAESSDEGTKTIIEKITHSGIKEVERTTRLYTTLKVEMLSLDVCNKSAEDPLVSLSAVKTTIKMNLFPDKDQMVVELALHDLACEDLRLIAAGRQFKSLVEQCREEGEAKQDLFLVSYVKNDKERRSETKLTVGAPRFVFIPDVIPDILSFLSLDKKEPAPQKERVISKPPPTTHIEVARDADAVEVSYNDDCQREKMIVCVKTAGCQIVLVDIGSSVSPNTTSEHTLSQATESIVLQGQIECDLEFDEDVKSGEVRTELEVRGNHFEMYTAHSRKLLSPLQIMEPTSFAVFYSSKSATMQYDELEFRAIGLSELDLTVSMQNIALVTAIASSLTQSNEEKDEKTEDGGPLSANEVARLEELASALEGEGGEASDSVRASVIRDDDTMTARSSRVVPEVSVSKWKIRLTVPKTKVLFVNDLQGLDEPLFRIGANNIVGGLEGCNGIFLSRVQPTFEGHINCTLSADYFDPSVNLWNRLLLKAWEVTVKTNRGVTRRNMSQYLSTSLDVESFPCFVSFSEQFLISLNSANTMWSIYTKATTSAVESSVSSSIGHEALAASAARNMVTSLPYGVENHCGVDIEFAKLHGKSQTERVTCAPGTIQYFRFEPPPGKGYGGKRLYGQDVLQLKRVQLFIGEEEITIDHLDTELGKPRVCHQLKNGWTLLTEVKRTAKSVILYVGSHVDLVNKTSIPFKVDVKDGESQRHVGICQRGTRGTRSLRHTSNFSSGSNQTLSNESDRFGIPLDFLATTNSTKLLVSPLVSNFASSQEVYGEITVPGVGELSLLANTPNAEIVFDVACVGQRNNDNEKNPLPDPFVVLVRFRLSLVGVRRHPFAELSLEPRASLMNKIPIKLNVRTPMPHTFASSGTNDSKIEKFEVTHTLAPNDSMEVFTPGPSFAISLKCADQPVSGGSTDWIRGTWMDLPMMREFRLPEPIKCTFPFLKPQELPKGATIIGSEFYVLEASEDMSENIFEQIDGLSKASGKKASATEGVEVQNTESPGEAMRSYLITVSNYGIDHTGNLVFEQVATNPGISSQSGSHVDINLIRRLATIPTSTPFSAFATESHGYRLSLLPGTSSFLRVLELTMESNQGLRRSLPFRIEDVSICDGGIESTPLRWEDHTESGYYLYRTLVNSYLSELHVIPEFIIYNASKAHRLCIRQVGAETVLGPEKIAPFKTHPKLGLVITLDYQDFGGRAGPIRVDGLNHSVIIVKSLYGVPLGSVAIQTVVGSLDSRLVVKIGEVQFGQESEALSMASENMFSRDMMRMRIRWFQLNVTLNEARPDNDPFHESLAKLSAKARPPKDALSARSPSEQEMTEQEHIESITQRKVCTVVFQRFTIDWQRIFKDNEANKTKQSNNPLLSPERSQLSVIIHHVQLLDESPDSVYPVVFDSTSESISLFDLCIRLRGALDADLVKVDLFDLNLAHLNGKSDKIIIRTSEDFAWNLLDVADRITSATEQVTAKDVKLEWDEDRQEYHVIVEEQAPQTGTVFDKPTTYTPPPTDTLYDISQARVSPCSIVVSFKRKPQASRYKEIRDVRGAKLINYFTRRLKFTLENAELNFNRYIGRDIRGPPSRLAEILSAVYASRMKMKIVSILTATSIQDWKYLAARDAGDDGLAEGDYMRVTGNLAGSTAGYIARKVGSGIGESFVSASNFVGDEIENVSSRLGARSVGAGVNSAISGIGGGLGSAVKGVGSGAGKVLKGAGKGVGQMVGGVTGAVVLAGKGIGKGVTKGDGKAVLDGFAEGGASMANGVGQGVETAVMGAADGVLTVGKGVFSGVKNIGRGFGGAFTRAKKKLPNKTQE